MATLQHYPGIMARVWLTLILAFALATGGIASAFAAECPMEQAQVVSVHDCCPDSAGANRGQPQQNQKQKADACLFGMACRTAPAMAPTFASLMLSQPGLRIAQPIASEPAKPSGPLQQLFRPPRTI
ncbi:MAG TPA: hypothetical protein VG735_05975 [Caulobacterales bacterium]|nr:hypothetical protein [Caulobacterales bacterium]